MEMRSACDLEVNISKYSPDRPEIQMYHSDCKRSFNLLNL